MQQSLYYCWHSLVGTTVGAEEFGQRVILGLAPGVVHLAEPVAEPVQTIHFQQMGCASDISVAAEVERCAVMLPPSQSRSCFGCGRKTLNLLPSFLERIGVAVLAQLAIRRCCDFAELACRAVMIVCLLVRMQLGLTWMI